MATKLKTAYDDSLLEVDNINTWLKVSTDSNETDLIQSLLKAAIELVNNRCNISVLEQTYERYWDDFPSDLDGLFKLYPANVTAVTSIVYKDAANATQTLSTDVYQVNMVDMPAKITLKPFQYYPISYGTVNNLVVTFKAGWSSWDAVPEMLKTAIQMIVATWYENRQNAIVGRMVSTIPFTTDDILQNSGYLIKEF